MSQWDFFLAHAGPDKATAEALYKLLSRRAKVFLDSLCLRPGDTWPDELRKAQSNSQITVILISARTNKAYYQKEEIARAIDLARAEPKRHRAVPVFIDESSETASNVPYGLKHLQAVFFTSAGSLERVAEQLLAVLRTEGRTSWEYYERLFAADRFDIAYIPIVNSFEVEPKKLPMSAVTVELDGQQFVLPPHFRTAAVSPPARNDPSCRLSRYSVEESGALRLTISRTAYADYLRSGEHLDDPLPGDPGRTFRDEFGRLVGHPPQSLRPFNLTNICGVGVFVVSRDNCVLASRHSEQSHVYPGRLTFSASGTMKWGAFPHPFTEVMRKAFEEIRHQINPSELYLVGFGADARKLYFQFSFAEWTHEKVKDLVDRCGTEVTLEEIPLDPDEIVARLLADCWEPAAAAAILTLCRFKFSHEQVTAALRAKEQLWPRKRMRDEWDYRATRPGNFADMSVRYPADRIEAESARYVEAVLQFVGSSCDGASVLEAGCGTGRITRRLAVRASGVTAVDLCPRMLRRNRQRMGEHAQNVDYREGFIQDLQLSRHDVAICSQVLVHNTVEEDFRRVVAALCRSSSKIFLFEDVSDRPDTSPHTKLRSDPVIRSEFLKHGYQVCGSKTHKLFDDTVLFLELAHHES